VTSGGGVCYGNTGRAGGPEDPSLASWLIVVVVVVVFVIFVFVVVVVVIVVVVVVCNHSVCGKACVTAKAHIHKNQPGPGIRGSEKQGSALATGNWQLGGPAKDRLECNDVDTRHSTHTHDKPPLVLS